MGAGGTGEVAVDMADLFEDPQLGVLASRSAPARLPHEEERTAREGRVEASERASYSKV
jgi:hypothetical protein